MSAGTERIDAMLVLWRVFGMTDVYGDRPLPQWSVEETRGPKQHDRVQVSIGDLPEDLSLTLRQWHAQKPWLLDFLTGKASGPDERQASFEQSLVDGVPPEFDDPYPMWFAVRLHRPLPVTGRQGVVVGWVADDVSAIGEAFDAFEEHGNRYLDGAVARLLAAIRPMNLGRLCYSDRRAFLTAPGRAAITTPQPKVTVRDAGLRVERAGGWSSAPILAITEAMRSMPSGAFSKKITGAAEWFVASRAAKDSISRFIFAFAGLELLATQVEKNSRRALTEQLRKVNSNLPINELLWPSTDDDRVSRNFLFRFAAMSTLYSSDTAIQDVEKARSLLGTRNNFFHGVERVAMDDRAVECQELLRRYLALVAVGA